MLRDDLLRGFLQIARAAVIPEAGPEAQHFFLRRSGERVNVREALQKSFVVRNRRRNTGLLQHDFRKPDVIGIFRPPPRQVALELAKPTKQLFAKCGELAAVQHSAGTFSHSEWARHSGLSVSSDNFNEPDRQECLSYLLHRVVEEDDVRRTPHRIGDGAMGLGGDDDFEKFGRRREIGH